jgi:signal peptidase II
MILSPKARRFWPLAAAVLLADCATKAVAARYLSPADVAHPVIGDVLRFTLAYNRGAAMGLGLAAPRLLLSLVAAGALLILLVWYRRTAPTATGLAAALALLWGGAAGNLLDRLESPRGVVDFIDIGLGQSRFWTFNLADVAITLGAVALALLLSRERPGPEEPADG